MPSSRRMAASRAAVVLLPLVPVMATTRASAKSSSQRAMAVVTSAPDGRAAASSGRYRLTPGARTTAPMSDQATVAGIGHRHVAAEHCRTPGPQPGRDDRR